ncbi:aldo/keto reductase [Altericista sp. CCNU0014]|uniref:aldo/keto reductase n=1 Tax=Altericista sp. CCNU0014 TaxID=3082949 RepID=UPI0038516484
MLYRRFGRTELQMPIFSCGGMRYQFKWQDVPFQEVPLDNQRNLEATIRRARELGINHIETARGYGSSEMQLGQILPAFPRQKSIVQTKVAPTASAREFRQTFEQSLAYLKLDYVDLLGLHGLNNEELYNNTFKPEGCIEVARQLRAEGKVRFIGFSTHGPTALIRKAIATDAFDYINLHWYYIFQNNWPAILDAQKHDMGVFIISPSDKGGKLYNPPQKLVDLCAPLSPIVFNDLFCLSHSQVHTLSVGASKPSDFDEHLKALDLLDCADAILPPILARLEETAIAILGENWYKTWNQGLPSHEATPGGINIPTILWLWNLANAYDLEEYAKMRYNLLGNGGHWFAGQPASQIETLDLQASLIRSPNAARIPNILKAAHARFGNEAVKRLSQQE